MTVAVLFNPNAGRRDAFRETGARLAAVLRGHKVLTGPGAWGSGYLDLPPSLLRPDDGPKAGPEALLEGLDKGCELVIGVGGDGFLNRIGSFLIDRGMDVPVMGIAGGTANVGPLIRFRADDLAGLSPEKLVFRHAAAVAVKGLERGHAFHDVVVGDTFIATLGEGMANVDAGCFLRTGALRSKRPTTQIAGPAFRIALNGADVHLPPWPVSQIVVSPLFMESFYVGKAVTGALCWAPHIGKQAVLVLSDRVIVDCELPEPPGPVQLTQVLFSEGDVVHLSGLAAGAHLVVDGNVLCPAEGSIAIGCIRRAIRYATPASEGLEGPCR